MALLAALVVQGRPLTMHELLPFPSPTTVCHPRAQPKLDPKIIGLRATGKWVHEFKYFRASSTGNLARFLDFVSYEYMIDNILVRIEAAAQANTAMCGKFAGIARTLVRCTRTRAHFAPTHLFSDDSPPLQDLIKAATSSQSIDMEAVVENTHPLGALE